MVYSFRLALSLVLVFTSLSTFAQTYTMCSSNSWSGATAWTSGSCGSGNTTIPNCSSAPCAINAVINSNTTASANGTYGVNNLTVNNNGGKVTVSGGSLTVYGTLTGNGDNTITINGGGTLTVAQLNMMGNNPTIQVNGILRITGNAVFDNKVSWNINGGGQVIIDGNLTMTNGASMQVNGSLTVKGNLTTGNNADININGGGVVTVNQNVSIGSGNLNGSGTFQFGGTCCLGGNCASNSSYCNSIHHNAALPVTLTSFNALVNGHKVDLAWSTATEFNFDYFNLQRSADGRKFESMATLPGNGTTKERHDYSYVDELPLTGRSYYRLQSVDFDGYTETFNVVSVDLDRHKDAMLYPIPVTDSNLSFRLNFLPQSEILISVTSIIGVERQRAFITSNETDATLNLNLEPGVYIVKMSSIDFNKVSRIVVK